MSKPVFELSYTRNHRRHRNCLPSAPKQKPESSTENLLKGRKDLVFFNFVRQLWKQSSLLVSISPKAKRRRMSFENDVVGGGGEDDEKKVDNDEDVVSESSIQRRHKREKKELQALITGLKRGVSKTDKAKKKEIANEIARLETELTKKHDQELTEFNEKKSKSENDRTLVEEKDDPTIVVEGQAPELDDREVENEDESNLASGNKSKKVTKAQKRRDKKEAKVKESERAVAQDKQEAKGGVRYKEHQSFKPVLAAKNLSFYEVPADGDCLYNALAHQLSLCGLSAKVVDLRQQAATIMKSNRDDYLPFLTNNDGDLLSQEEFDVYCAKLLNPGVWGGHPELVALSTFYKRPIEVLQANAAPILIGEQYAGCDKSLVITFHRHAFRLGEHYNSTAPTKTASNEDNDDDI